ncbi:MAG: glycosyltransferase family 39 protein, partial [Anaerolineae bacterium]
MLLAFGLRAYDLGRREFWFDEALTANVSALGWQGIVEHLRSAPFEHPPLYFLALYPWQQLAGTSEYAFRLTSALWGVLFVPLLYLLVRRWTDRPVALVAALLAVVSPFLVAYSQEARMYTVLPCLAVLALLVFVTALERPGQPAWWLAYLALLGVGTATHYFFAFLWLVTALYLAVDYARSRRLRPWALAAHALLLLAGVVWLAAAPGLRASLVRLAEGEAAFGLGYKLSKIMPTLMLSEVSGGDVPLAAYLLATAGWLLVLWGLWSSLRRPLLREPGRLLLFLSLVVPLVAALLLPYGVLGRHVGYLMVPILTFLAVGLVALRLRGWAWLAAGLLLLLPPTSYGLAVHYGQSGGDFGQAMAYIDRHARQGDLVILNQPAEEPLVTYYNRGGWPVRYMPPDAGPPIPEYVNWAMHDLVLPYQRLWLGPIGAWTADPDLLTERWLVAHAFPALKTWFPDSSSVSLYYKAAGDLTPVDVERAVWGGRLRLQSLAARPLEVPAGDALRLEFIWLAGPDLGDDYAVDLRLVDGEGLVWAERRSEPCGGWCPTGDWAAGALQEDRHALLIPPGTPPGAYRLQVAWVPAGGGAPLAVEAAAGPAQYLDLAEVAVLSAGAWTEDLEVPNPLQVSFGHEVRLLGYNLAPAELRAGQNLVLETYWQAVAAPTADYTLAVDLVDGDGQVAHHWRLSPFTGQYATGQWQAGEVLRGQQRLS